MQNLTVGFAVCGSFCTFSRVLPVLRELAGEDFTLLPIFSAAVYGTDTRFFKAADFRAQVEAICGRPVVHTLEGAEPIGPKRLLDALVVAPCTGNTLGKLAGGVTDSPVTLAVKAHLHNGRPVVVAVSTNDALAASAPNLGRLLATRHYYFVPMRQDDPAGKPTSLVADFSLTLPTLRQALAGRQLQPLLLGPAKMG